MASRNSTVRPSKTQTTPNNQTPGDWHEDRYGEHRDKLSDEHLKQVVEDICGQNYDEQAATALVLLMDEIERSQFDRLHICNIAYLVSHSAFKYTAEHEKAEKNLVASLRREVARKEVVN